MTKAELIELINRLPITDFEVESITMSCDNPTVVGLMIADSSIPVEDEPEQQVGNC
jgi:hypothetical protein